MKLSKDTLNVLKNFSNINGNLTIKPGNEIVTASAGRNLVATCVVEEKFESNFGIYDLFEFLGVLSLFDSPELTFSDKYVDIKEEKNGIRYFAADARLLTPVPGIREFPTPDVEFDLSSQMLNQIQRVASILRVTDFSVVGDGESISIQVSDKKNPSGNNFNSVIGSTDKTFKVNFKVENLKMMPGDYKVAIAGKKISRFQSLNIPLAYYVAIELDSTFDF